MYQVSTHVQAVLFGCWMLGEWDSWGGDIPGLVCMVSSLPMNPTPPTSNTQIILPVGVHTIRNIVNNRITRLQMHASFFCGFVIIGFLRLVMP